MNKEIEELLNELKWYADAPNEQDYNGEYDTPLEWEQGQVKLLLSYIEQLEKENKELKEDYERIYNENCKLREEHNITDISLLDENQQLKKQKDDVVEIIKRQLLSNTNITKYTDEMCLRDLLRMLGEINYE